MTRRTTAPLLGMAAALTLACAAFVGLGAQLAMADSRPPLPPNGRELAPGQLPHQCTASDTGAQGYYFSDTAQQWVGAPLCYAKWGNLAATGSQIVNAGSTVTVTAIPTDGSNSGTYAPQTGSISWQFPGKVVSGCGASDLSCSVVPTTVATTEWQWFEFHVSMPRTFFIDSPGDLCGGQHLCAGVTTNAWSYVGVPPAGSLQATPAWAIGTLGALVGAGAGVAAAGGLRREPSIEEIQRQHTTDEGGDGGKSGGGKTGGGKAGGSRGTGGKTDGGKAGGPGGGKAADGPGLPKAGDTGRRGPTLRSRLGGRPGKVNGP